MYLKWESAWLDCTRSSVLYPAPYTVLSTQEVESTGLEKLKGVHSQLHSAFEVNLAYMKLCLRKYKCKRENDIFPVCMGVGGVVLDAD